MTIRYFTFLYDSIIADASAVADSTAPNFTPQHMARPENWLVWLPGSDGQHHVTFDCGEDREADAFGFAQHQLFTSGGTISLEYSSDDVAYTTIVSPFTPYSDHPGYVEFGQVSARYWRIVLNSTPASPLGVAMIGVKEVMEQGHFVGFSPPGLNVDVETLTNTSRDGNLLGTAIRDHGAMLSLELDNLTDVWSRETWGAIRRHAANGTYFIQWDNENRPYETAYCWSSSSPEKVSYQDGIYSSTGLESRCMTAHHYEPPPNPPPFGYGMWIESGEEFPELAYQYPFLATGASGLGVNGLTNLSPVYIDGTIGFSVAGQTILNPVYIDKDL